MPNNVSFWLHKECWNIRRHRSHAKVSGLKHIHTFPDVMTNRIKKKKKKKKTRSASVYDRLLGGAAGYQMGDDNKVIGSNNVYYIEADELAAKLRDPEESKSVIVIDVRDEDFGDTMITGTTLNVPSAYLSQTTLEKALDTLGKSLADYQTVVFHCSFSKQRGPTCAKLVESFYPLHQFDIYVLRGGFCNWSCKYPDLLQPSKPFFS